MAMIVPVSHSQRWRSRSRNRSTDFERYLATQTQTTPTSRFVRIMSEDFHSDLEEQDEEDDDDDDEEMDDVQTSPWIVVPTDYVSSSLRRGETGAAVAAVPLGSPTTARQHQKTMEKRRASGLLA